MRYLILFVGFLVAFMVITYVGYYVYMASVSIVKDIKLWWERRQWLKGRSRR